MVVISIAVMFMREKITKSMVRTVCEAGELSGFFCDIELPFVPLYRPMFH